MFTNPFNQKAELYKVGTKNLSSEKLANKANELFKDKPFTDDNRNTYLIASALKYVANVVSFISAFFAFKFVLSYLVGGLIASLAALALCALLEFLKNSLLSSTAKMRLRYRKTSIGTLFLVVLSALSIGASCFGAYIMLDDFTPNTPLTFTKQDSIVLKEIEHINAQIANNSTIGLELSTNVGQSGTIKKTLQSVTAQQKTLQARKDSLNNDYTLIVQSATERQNNAIKAENNKLSVVRISLLGTALIFELVYLICAAFCLLYLHRAYLDSAKPSPQNKPFKTHNNDINQQVTTEPHQRQTIGFKPNDGVKYVVHRGKKYTSTSIKGNINANKAKVQKYESIGDLDKAAKYAENLEIWENYLKQVQ